MCLHHITHSTWITMSLHTLQRYFMRFQSQPRVACSWESVSSFTIYNPQAKPENSWVKQRLFSAHRFFGFFIMLKFLPNLHKMCWLADEVMWQTRRFFPITAEATSVQFCPEQSQDKTTSAVFLWPLELYKTEERQRLMKVSRGLMWVQQPDSPN